AGKRLRYGMEIFAGALGSNFRKELYPRVAAIQEKLRDINDHVTAPGRYQQLLDATEHPGQRSLLSRLLGGESRAVEACLAAFFQFWPPARADSLREQFSSALVGRSGRTMKKRVS